MTVQAASPSVHFSDRVASDPQQRNKPPAVWGCDPLTQQSLMREGRQWQNPFLLHHGGQLSQLSEEERIHMRHIERAGLCDMACLGQWTLSGLSGKLRPKSDCWMLGSRTRWFSQLTHNWTFSTYTISVKAEAANPSLWIPYTWCIKPQVTEHRSNFHYRRIEGFSVM